MQAFFDLIVAVKRALPDNFLSSFLAIASSILVGHFEAVVKKFNECPIPLLFSKSTGNGKLITCHDDNGYSEGIC